MRRRTFLKIAAATVGTQLLKGCGDDGADGPLLDPLTHALDGTPLEVDEARFPQSIASGDATASTVILWARVFDPDARASGADVTLRVEAALDEGFSQPLALNGRRWLDVSAEAFFDHCAKVRLEGLDPSTTVHFRFLHIVDGVAHSSRFGRTRTAPSEDDESPVRFAFASCQDFNGRYYHPWRAMLEDEPDFVLHLGDYVYETTGDPGFQITAPDRRVTFEDNEGAIVFNEGTEEEYHAARTLEQYRTLYRTTRSDRDLQGAHERYPFICTWDDHEFSDDAWGANGTYFAGRVDEEDVPRRKAANQAWFEYMPVDYPAGPDFRYDPEADFPGDLVIYRDLRWGALAHILMPDVRTWRTEHVVDEGGFPGRIILTAEELAAGGGPPAVTSPYVDLDAPGNAPLADLVRDGASVIGYDAAHAHGLVSVSYLDTIANTLDPDGEDPDVPRVPDEERDALPRGIAFHHIGKTSPYSRLGARDLVIEEPFLRYAAHLWEQTGGESEDMLGPDQEAWFIETMQNSTARWKVWGNAFPLSNMAVDLRNVSIAPPSLAQRFIMAAEDWAGMPNRRHALLSELRNVENVLVCTGDRHAFLAATPHPDEHPEHAVVEFVTGAISSGTYGSIVMRYAQSDPALQAAGAPALAVGLRDFLLDRSTSANPHLAETLVREHGYVLVELSNDEALTTFRAWPETGATSERPPRDSARIDLHFRVRSGSRTLERRTEDGQWQRWNMAAEEWVAST